MPASALSSVILRWPYTGDRLLKYNYYLTFFFQSRHLSTVPASALSSVILRWPYTGDRLLKSNHYLTFFFESRLLSTVPLPALSLPGVRQLLFLQHSPVLQNPLPHWTKSKLSSPLGALCAQHIGPLTLVMGDFSSILYWTSVQIYSVLLISANNEHIRVNNKTVWSVWVYKRRCSFNGTESNINIPCTYMQSMDTDQM